MRRILFVAAATLLGALGLSAQQRNIDTQKSTMTIHVGKTGAFSGFGHEHEVRAPIHSGTADTGAHPAVEIHVNARDLRVMDPDASDQDRAEVQATMLGAEPSDPGEHDYTEIVDTLRVRGAAAQQDVEELWRRIAFSILITNVDDHLRNHGFLHANHGQWRLAPAFDLNPFPDRARELKTWISPETGPEATVEALLSVAPYFKIPKPRAKEILARVERAVAGWRDEGRAIGMSDAELEPFAPAFEHAEREAARGP